MQTPTHSLLVYIPTYNRYERLCEQLDLILPHMDNYNVSVIVSNNASTDEKYAGLQDNYHHSKITIINNKINFGGNPNIFNGFVYGLNYDYLWILSDDDTITPDAIPKIMDRLDNKNDMIYLIDCGNDIYITYDQNRFLNNMKYGLGLISCVIYKTSTIKDHITVGYEYFNSGFPHLSVIFSVSQHKWLRVIEYPKEIIFKNKAMDPPVDKKAYVPAIYGFITLADFIKDKKRKYNFIRGYIIHDFNMWSVVEYKYKYPEKYNNMGGYILAHSLRLYAYFVGTGIIMSVMHFVWDNLSVDRREYIKTVVKGVLCIS